MKAEDLAKTPLRQADMSKRGTNEPYTGFAVGSSWLCLCVDLFVLSFLLCVCVLCLCVFLFDSVHF